jgi:LysM repeat protein
MMSAAAAVPGPTLLGDRRPRRTHLHLVPPVGTSVAGGDTSLRLTRRGRLAVTLSMLVTLTVSLLAVLLAVLPADAGREVVVRPGQTLSEIAVAQLPGLTPDRAMVSIQRANGMNTAQVQAGQTLVIPGR